jgi:hypothetical protein
MLPREMIEAPTVVCCGYPVVWEFVEEMWLASCWLCRREFICADPPARGAPSCRRGGP